MSVEFIGCFPISGSVSVWMDERSLIALKGFSLIRLLLCCERRQSWKHTVLLFLAEESFQDEAGSFSENETSVSQAQV